MANKQRQRHSKILMCENLKFYKHRNIELSSDQKWTNYSLLDSSHQGESNGGKIVVLGHIYDTLPMNVCKYSVRICH